MITIDNTYTRLNDKLRGRKPKFKLKKGEDIFIFKYGAINYEIWSELIAEQLGIQVGIEMAHYELASCNGQVGVLTNFFLKPGELIISSDMLKLTAKAIFSENNINDDLKDNTILNIVQSAYTYDPNINSSDLIFSLLKRWAFFGLIMESDKNETNIAFIKSNTGIKLAPDYDNSSMARLNEDINDLINAMRKGYGIYTLTDNITNSLKVTDKDSPSFIKNFESVVLKYPNQATQIMNDLEKLDIEKAISKVEEINSCTVPWEVSYWLSTAIGKRMHDMKNIYNQVVMNQNDRELKI